MIRSVLRGHLHPGRFCRRSIVPFKSKVADFYDDRIGGEACAGKNEQQEEQSCWAKTHGHVTCYSIYVSGDNETKSYDQNQLLVTSPGGGICRSLHEIQHSSFPDVSLSCKFLPLCACSLFPFLDF